MKTEYAEGYRHLIQIAQTNGMRLVLANFSMAVNERSPADMIEFYREIDRAIFQRIRANLVHSLIVRELAGQHPDVCYVDTQPHLDGENSKFIDVVHFSHTGEQQMAETFFSGIRDTLERDLSPVGQWTSNLGESRTTQSMASYPPLPARFEFHPPPPGHIAFGPNPSSDSSR